MDLISTLHLKNLNISNTVLNECIGKVLIQLLPLNAQDCSSWLNENHIMDLFRLFSNTCTCTFLLKIVNSLSEKS